MYEILMANRIDYLVVIVMSFICFVAARYTARNSSDISPMARTVGIGFFILLINSTAAFLYDGSQGAMPDVSAVLEAQNKVLGQPSKTLMLFAELGFLLFMLGLISSGNIKGRLKTARVRDTQKVKLFEFLGYTTAIVLLFSATYFKQLWSMGDMLHIKTTLPTLICIAAIIAAVSKKKPEKMISTALILYVCALFARIYPQSIILSTVSLSFKLSSFLIFYAYIYKNTVKRLQDRLEDAEKRLAALDNDIHFEVRKRTIEIERSNEKLVSIAKTDAMTGIYNKKGIIEEIQKLLDKKMPHRFAILMFDIDKFKKINDTLGHITGDVCIKRAAAIGRGSIREFDSIGRYGGDEFIIILPDSNLSEAKIIAERLRSKIENETDPRFSISIGISTCPEDGTNPTEIIGAADQGIYHSKSKGGNAVSYKNLI